MKVKLLWAYALISLFLICLTLFGPAIEWLTIVTVLFVISGPSLLGLYGYIDDKRHHVYHEEDWTDHFHFSF